MISTISTAIFSMIVSIYSLQLQSIEEDAISLGDYAGKKIVFVNIATGSPDASQLFELEQLYETHKDSLVVIGLPSNSFNNEMHTNQELKAILTDSFHISFPVAAISPVSGEDANSVFGWLASAAGNGVLNGAIHKDFQKFLINTEGRIYGIFSNEVPVTDEKFQYAISLTNNSN
ncbi:MAG TPA: hypothetical protein VFW07_09490 [Parafilimonas sp.]|nr:hypothetical protein [Parafilimonas sp.]